MITTWSIPDKVEDLYPQKALELEKNRRVLVDFFLKNKFELISPAMIEYADNVSFNGKSVDSDMFKLSDPLSGRLIGITPDLTIQTARIDNYLASSSNDIKSYCYCGPVLKADTSSFNQSREELQVGVEIYGNEKIEADIKPLLDSRVDVEGNLTKLREHFNELNEIIRANERKIHETDIGIEEFNSNIQKYKLERQGFISESAIFEEQLKNDNYEIQGLLDQITENMTEESLVEEISKIENSIERIGPINLAAAEEYKLEEERKSEIDSQMSELNSALET